MPAPKRLKIAGTTYHVEYVPEIMTDDGDELAGDCLGSAQRIRVSTSQGADRQRSTLLHEAVHAIADELNYNWPEELVLQAERMIWMLARDNPGLIRYIRERTKE